MPNQGNECKACGAPLNISAAVNGVAECEYCHRKQTVSRTQSTDAAYFLKMGEHDLDCCKFDEAYNAYKKAAEHDKHESEAYFGMALAEYKVQYIKDTVNNTLQPICHEISEKIFSESKNYQAALLCATEEQKEQYRLRAREIDEVRKEFYALRKSGLDYDCFICVKVSENGERTDDYKIADDMYFHLKEKGYKPFFSEREIKNRTGADYEAIILYALYTSECMIVVCGNEEYLKTPWVQNEYARFLSMINDEQKESDSITIAFGGKPIEKLPGRNGKIQGIDMTEFGASERIIAFVETHTPEARARREAAAANKTAEEERLKRQLEELKAQQEAARLELERKLASVQNSDKPAAQSAGGATVQSLLVRAKQFLNAGDFENAKSYCDRVLDIDPENADAWVIALFSENKENTIEKLINKLYSTNDVKALQNTYLFKNAQIYAEDNEQFIALSEAISDVYDTLSEKERMELERKEEEAREREIRMEKQKIEYIRQSKITELQNKIRDKQSKLNVLECEVKDLESIFAQGFKTYLSSRPEMKEFSQRFIGAILHLIGLILAGLGGVFIGLFFNGVAIGVPVIVIFMMIGVILLLIGEYLMSEWSTEGVGFAIFMVVLIEFSSFTIGGSVHMIREFIGVSRRKQIKKIRHEYVKKIQQLDEYKSEIVDIKKSISNYQTQIKELSAPLSRTLLPTPL